MYLLSEQNDEKTSYAQVNMCCQVRISVISYTAINPLIKDWNHLKLFKMRCI